MSAKAQRIGGGLGGETFSRGNVQCTDFALVDVEDAPVWARSGRGEWAALGPT